ncbi:MAG: hypothetical protein OEW16_03915 [Gammaproteobacteria bacterium]|nr:hypothetical protein [Gammaproteobacteria bacterium]
MSRDAIDELPILTDIVELHATGSFPRPDPEDDASSPYDSSLLSPDDISALQAALVSRMMNLTDELLHAAARDIEAVMFERVIDRLRAALPELVAAALREHLATNED